MHLEDGNPTILVRPINENMSVKSPCAQEGGIEDLRPVRCADENDTATGVETVHLDQKLVECLLPLLVDHRADASRLAQRVELVDEDDAGRLPLRLDKQVTHARRAYPNEEFYEL